MAAALERIATLLSLKGENEFKTRAYTRAARQIIRLEPPCEGVSRPGELQELPGIGKALAQKIEELVTTGESRLLARLEAEVPAGLLALFSIPGVGHKTAAKMVRELNLRSLEDLEEAAREGRVRSLHGLGPVVEQNILRYFQESRSGEILYHRGVALPVAGAAGRLSAPGRAGGGLHGRGGPAGGRKGCTISCWWSAGRRSGRLWPGSWSSF